MLGSQFAIDSEEEKKAIARAMAGDDMSDISGPPAPAGPMDFGDDPEAQALSVDPSAESSAVTPDRPGEDDAYSRSMNREYIGPGDPGDDSVQPLVPSRSTNPQPRTNDPMAGQPARGESGFDWGRALVALGSGDLGAYDAQKRYNSEAPERARLAAEAQGMRAEDLAAKKQKRQLAEDAINPASAISREAQKRYADTMKAYAESMGATPEYAGLSKHFASQIDAAPKMSASQIDRALGGYEKVLGGTTKMMSAKAQSDLAAQGMGIKERTAAATEKLAGSTIDDRKNDNALGWARFALDKQKADKAGEKVDVTTRKPQEKLNTEINNFNIALKQMSEISDLKKDVNTGLYVGTVSDFLNKYVSSELTSQERKELDSMVARVFNRETKSLAGSAVSAPEWARIAPQIPSMKDDDSLFMAKLKKAMSVTKEILAEKQKEYQRTPAGGTIDSSVVAAENAKTTSEKPPPVAVGKTATNKATGEKVQWDGKAWVPVKK